MVRHLLAETLQPQGFGSAVGSLWEALGLVPLLCKPVVNFDRRRELTALVMPLLVALAELHEATHDIRVLLVVAQQLVWVRALCCEPCAECCVGFAVFVDSAAVAINAMTCGLLGRWCHVGSTTTLFTAI